MEPLATLAIYSVVIVIISLVGGSLPLVYSWSSKQLHLFTGLSAGFFIAAAFLILIPSSVELMDAHEALALVMVGLIAILLVERVILTHHHTHHHAHSHDHECDHDCEHGCEHEDEGCEHVHTLTSAAAFAGLAVHGIMDGFALGVAAMLESEIGAVLFTAIIAHKGIEVLALATTFKLADFSTKRSMGLVAVFSLMVPAAAFAAIPFIDFMESIEVGFPLALAAGTFLYVGICDLLPEAFHLEKKGYRAFLMVVLGIALMYVITQVAGHLH